MNEGSVDGPGLEAGSVTLVDDALLVQVSSSDAGSGTSTSTTLAGPRVEQASWVVLDAKTGRWLGKVQVDTQPTDLSPVSAVLGKDADGEPVLAVRRVVRVPGVGVQPGRTDQLLGLYDVSTGNKLWEVDALLGDPPSNDPNSLSGTRPINPVGFAGGNLVGYSASSIPADSANSKLKAVSVSDGSLVWSTPSQAIQYTNLQDVLVLSTRPSDPDNQYFGTIEVRNAATGEIVAAKTLPVTESEAFFGGVRKSYSTVENLVELPDGNFVVEEELTSLDSEGEVMQSRRVEVLDSALMTKWSMDGVTLSDSPGGGVVALSTEVANNNGIGLQGVDATSGSKLWSISPDDLETTDFSLSPSISDGDDLGDTRGFIFGSARDETRDPSSSLSASGQVILDARSGAQIYVGSSQSPNIETDGIWTPGIFVRQRDGDVLGYYAPKPPLGVSDDKLRFPN